MLDVVDLIGPCLLLLLLVGIVRLGLGLLRLTGEQAVEVEEHRASMGEAQVLEPVGDELDGKIQLLVHEDGLGLHAECGRLELDIGRVENLPKVLCDRESTKINRFLQVSN